MYYSIIEPKLWKIDAEGMMVNSTTFSEKIVKCSEKCVEVSKELELSTVHSPELLNRYIETHHELLMWLNRFAEYKHYFTSIGRVE